MSIPFKENHELHGLLLAPILVIVFKFASPGTDAVKLLTYASFGGALAAAYMQSFGHPDFIKKFLPYNWPHYNGNRLWFG